MTKREFLSELRQRLSTLSREEREERLGFYGEMIDDRIEEGMSESDAVSAVGSVDEVARQIGAERGAPSDERTPKDDLVRSVRVSVDTRSGGRGSRGWVIALLALGSPIWLSLLIAAFAIVVSVYAVLWSLVVSAWAVFVSLAVSAPACVVFSMIFICRGSVISALATLGAAAVTAGLAILFFFVSLIATKGCVWLSVRIAVGIKEIFTKKENK